MNELRNMTIDELQREYNHAAHDRDHFRQVSINAETKLERIWDACQTALNNNDIEPDHPLITNLIDLGLATHRSWHFVVQFTGRMFVNVQSAAGIDEDRVIETFSNFAELTANINEGTFSGDGTMIDVQLSEVDSIEFDVVNANE